MSDPRYPDPRRHDESRGYGDRRSDVSFWRWLTAALTVLGLIIGGIIGYTWGDHDRRAQSNSPTTTGSAPSQQRPAPETR
jgi:hypothetical protein